MLESMEDKKERDKYLDAMYAPRAELHAGLAGSGYKPKPAGFEEGDDDAAFDAFMAAASGTAR